MKTIRKVAVAGAVAACTLIGGAVGASMLGTANAATPAPSTGTTSAPSTDANPGDNGADGVPESQEHHDGHGALDLSGTVTAVGANSVTIKTSTGTTTYSVTSSSDIDKNGEASLSSLVVGDAVRFSVDASNTKQIDKLHAGDEAKDFPQGANGTASSSSTQGPSGV